MALIFPRLAQNFIKHGYFPTDEDSLGRIVQALDANGPVRLLDPCCGEGAALAEVKRALLDQGLEAQALGVEIDAERAWHAKTWLDQVIHADLNDVVIGPRSIGLLFLNPPYGDVLSDKGQISAPTGAGKDRLEKRFYRMSMGMLAFGGVMVLIVPHYVMDAEFATMVSRNFSDVRAFMAPTQQFKQLILFGVKRRADGVDSKMVAYLEGIGRGDLPEVLPEQWHLPCYAIPTAPTEALKFQAIRIDAQQLTAELTKTATLWPQFERHFGGRVLPHRRPLCAPSDWHLALALAAGQLTGVVESEDGRKFLITGDTFKEKVSSVAFDEDADGNLSEITTMTDRFIPMITAIDFTPGAGFGDIVSIK